MRLDHDLLTDTLLLKTPGWARVGLAAPTSRMRHEAARELVRAIIEEIGDDRSAAHPAQLGLDM